MPARDSVIFAIMLRRLGGKVVISDEEISRFDMNGVHIVIYDDIALSKTVIELRRLSYMRGEIESETKAIVGKDISDGGEE